MQPTTELPKVAMWATTSHQAPSPRTPGQAKRKPADDESSDAKKPKADPPAKGKQPQKPPSPAANTPKAKQPKGKGAGKPAGGKGGHNGGKGGHNGGKGGKGDDHGEGAKSKQPQQPRLRGARARRPGTPCRRRTCSWCGAGQRSCLRCRTAPRRAWRTGSSSYSEL